MKKVIIAIVLACFLLGLILWNISIHIDNVKNTQERKGHELYSNVQSALQEYPKLSDPFSFSKFYFCDGSTEYLLLRNGEKQITGMRSGDNKTIYYMDGKTWEMTEAGLTEMDTTEDPVQTVIANQVKALLDDREIRYAYHEASGLPLPIWVYTGEAYIEFTRTRYPGYMEVMVYDELDYGKYLRWNIARSSEDVVLFLWMQEYMLQPNTDDHINIVGWGEIEQEIANTLFE